MFAFNYFGRIRLDSRRLSAFGGRESENPISSMANNQLNLVCPRCETQSGFSISPIQSYNQLRCIQCSTDFVAWVAKIRAKNSRQDKKSNSRHYAVRTIDVSGAERLIEFMQAGTQAFELRSGDRAVFIYLGNRLVVVQNLTIGQYLSLRVTSSGCFNAVAVLATIVLAVGLVAVALTFYQ